MRTVVGLMAMVALVLGVMAGCDSAPSETVYREVTVGPMTLSIPDDWERPEDMSDFISDAMGSIDSELSQYFWVDVYGSSGGDLVLAIMVAETSEMMESLGAPWEGWEALMEATGDTKESYLASFGAEVFEECTQTLTIPRTIHGNEAIEGQFECMDEDAPPIVDVLMFFAEEDLGIMMFAVEEVAVEEYEEIWETIRDSVQFYY